MKQLYLGPILAIAFAASAAAQTASPKPAALTRLETMVSNLGYTTTDSSDNQHFTIAWDDPKYNYTLDFSVSPDNTIAYVFVQLTTFSAQQVFQLPYVKMLEADDSDDFYYSAENATNGGERVYGNMVLPLGNLTPPVLRSYLTDFVTDLDKNANQWDPTLWK